MVIIFICCFQNSYPVAGSEGLVEDVVLLGAPVSGDVKHWRPLCRVVAGRIVNGYSRYEHLNTS